MNLEDDRGKADAESLLQHIMLDPEARVRMNFHGLDLVMYGGMIALDAPAR